METITNLELDTLGKRNITKHADVMESNITTYFKLGRNAGFGNSSESEWYSTQRETLSDLADEFDTTLDIVCQICAHVSPMMRWDRNLVLTRDVLELCNAVSFNEAIKRHTEIGCFDMNSLKAVESYFGKDTKFGPKTYAFYQNLLGNTEHVTIDRHAVASLIGNPTAGNYPISPQGNEPAQQIYINVAQRFGVAPSMVQSVVWEYRQEIVLKSPKSKNNTDYPFNITRV